MPNPAEPSPQPATGADPPSAVSRPGVTELASESGLTSIADSVVAKIAGVAAREISGVHAMGSGRARAAGAIRQRLGGTDAAQGVSVEVGRRQAAIDIDVTVEYGVSIVDLTQAVRENVINEVQQLTGLEVTEVNISVNDVWLGDAEPAESRVQ